MWNYSVSQGALRRGAQQPARGFSGSDLPSDRLRVSPLLRDSPLSGAVPYAGSIPFGLYRMHVRRFYEAPDSKIKPPVIVLSPVGHGANGRKDLLIHGGTRSEGCIIVDKPSREALVTHILAGEDLIFVGP